MRHFTPLFIFLILFSSCEKESQQINDPDQNVVQQDPNIAGGDILSFLQSANGLRITSFKEEGENKTSWFSGYLFQFMSDGTVFATNGGQKISGTYRVFRDDGKTELSMTFAVSGKFAELTDDWYFIRKTSESIHFEDSGDTVVFQIQ